LITECKSRLFGAGFFSETIIKNGTAHSGQSRSIFTETTSEQKIQKIPGRLKELFDCNLEEDFFQHSLSPFSYLRQIRGDPGCAV
jgi:hypothetical protein